MVVHTQTEPGRRRGIVRPVMLTLLFLAMTVPVYLLVVNSFKTQEDILNNPFSLPVGDLTLDYLWAAVNSPQYNVIGGYGFTLFLVVVVDVLCILLAGPAAYVIARSLKRRTQLVLLYFLAGTFIPAAALVIPVIYVLRSVGLANTVTGLVAHDVASTLPVSIFLFVGFIRTIPVSIDQAAMIDGAGRLRTFWTIVFPLMRPAVVTVLILNSIGIWNDFVSPQILLSPGSGRYTVTTAIYAGISQYSTDLTKVFPNLLLAVAPVVIFFVYMQRHIISGLTVGAVKG
ncbi:raffinose/stachyose/melibiose transport system permease protein [Streptosporangium becharense]|uniref:Raffinose/stachyose/melibiose transport system permease protein n=1 Tax=Streptosporangium becharense TaxID=1816182 RepID=A0A7W9IAH5_9ACTN|nr:carbohydrate ABC transporter permease [Streptosporangium becharense]MBB2915352.1 raffinose/stachyose/melibiose transport system permease protein [Streptosporangium becharense]MBB5816950.1 raffinose/stachyose/melibiose transport system permease protein [Streptosporangium becharense]